MKKSTATSLQSSKSNFLGLFSFQSLLDHLQNNPTYLDLSDCGMQYGTTGQWQQLGDGLLRCVALDELIISVIRFFLPLKKNTKQPAKQ